MLRSALANRRTFLKYSIAAGAIIRPISSQAAVLPYYNAVFDERFDEPRLFAHAAAARHIPIVAIRGDVTNLFFHDLDLRWNDGPIQMAGYTTPASLFCLDLLARDRGMRLSHCAAKPSLEEALGVLNGTLPRRCVTARLPTDSSDLLFWIIAPSARASAKETVHA